MSNVSQIYTKVRSLIKAQIVTTTLVTLLAFSFSGLLLISCGSEPLPAGQAEYAEALEELQHGSVEKGTELLTSAEKVDPASPWRLLGEAANYQITSASMGALKSCAAMLAVAPDFDSAYTVYCRLALDHNKRFLALTVADQYNRKFNLTDPATADPERRRNYLLIMGRVALQSGESTEAVNLLTDIANERKADTRLRLALAEALYSQGNGVQANDLANSAFTESDESRDDIQAMIDYCILSGQANRATELIEGLIDDDPENLALLRFAFERYVNLGYLDYAEETVFALETLDKSETLVRYLKGGLAEAVGEFNRARLFYEWAFSKDIEESANIAMFRDFARANSRMGSHVSAMENFELLIMYSHRDNHSTEYLADVQMDYADMYQANRQWLDGLERSEKARPEFNNSPQLEMLRATALLKLLMPDSARGFMNHYGATAPNTVEWNQALARGWAQFDEIDSVAFYLDRALKLEPYGFGSLMALSQLQVRRSDSVGYESTVGTLVDKYGDDRRVLRIQASLYASRGEDVRLLDVANRMIELYPGDLQTYQLAARTAARKYGAEQAREFLNQAVTNNSDLPAAYHMLGISFLSQGDIDSAIVYLDKVVESRPHYAATRLAQGVIFESKGFIDSAIAVYTEMIERDPFSSDAHNNLAWVLANNDLEVLRAANLAREAISLSGGVKANPYGTYGWALFKLGKYDQAVTVYQRALKLAPNDPMKYYFQGVNFEKLEKTEEARESLQTAINLGISGNYLTLTQQALTRLKG